MVEGRKWNKIKTLYNEINENLCIDPCQGCHEPEIWLIQLLAPVGKQAVERVWSTKLAETNTHCSIAERCQEFLNLLKTYKTQAPGQYIQVFSPFDLRCHQPHWAFPSIWPLRRALGCFILGFWTTTPTPWGAFPLLSQLTNSYSFSGVPSVNIFLDLSPSPALPSIHTSIGAPIQGHCNYSSIRVIFPVLDHELFEDMIMSCCGTHNMPGIYGLSMTIN